MIRFVNGLSNALTWPATVAHEATHLAAGWPWIQRVEGYNLHPLRSHAWVSVSFRSETPGWAIVIAGVAPTLLGVVFAAAFAMTVLVTGGELPAGGREPLLWLLVGAYWLIYTTPSRGDLTAYWRHQDGDSA